MPISIKGDVTVLFNFSKSAGGNFIFNQIPHNFTSYTTKYINFLLIISCHCTFSNSRNPRMSKFLKKCSIEIHRKRNFFFYCLCHYTSCCWVVYKRLYSMRNLLYLSLHSSSRSHLSLQIKVKITINVSYASLYSLFY